MKQVWKKSVTALVVLILIFGSHFVKAGAAEPELTYGVEYTESQTIVTLYISVIDAFDIALIYDPARVHVASAGFTTEFKKLQANGANTTISIYNDDAVDNAGNTYAVFTGAGMSGADGGGIDFAGKPLASIVFEGTLAGTEIRLITNSAAEENVMNAEVKETISLGESAGTVITPAPVSNDEQNVDSNVSGENSAVQNAENPAVSDVQDAGSDKPQADAENPDTAEADALSENSAEDAPEIKDAEAENEEGEAEDDAAQADDEETKKKTSLFAWIGGGVAFAAAAAGAVLFFLKRRTKR